MIPLNFLFVLMGMVTIHELGHILYAKYRSFYQKTILLRVSGILEGRTLRLGVFGKIPLGVAIKTDLSKETVYERFKNCLCGIFAGLLVWAACMGCFGNYYYAVLLLVTYLAACCFDIIGMVQMLFFCVTKGSNTKLEAVV